MPAGSAYRSVNLHGLPFFFDGEKGLYKPCKRRSVMNKSNVVPFNFQSHEVRVVTHEDEPWFVAKDVCDVLELSNPTESLRGLDGDELTSEKLRSGGQVREMNIISESGLYTLVIRSNKPQAKTFRRWVTHEVLPSIRKTGGYSLPVSQKQLHPDSLTEVGYAARSAARVARAMGVYGKIRRQRLVSDLVLEATGYNLLERLQVTGVIGNGPVDDADPIEMFFTNCLEEAVESSTQSREVYEAFLYYWKEILGKSETPPHIVGFNRRLRQLGAELIKRGGVIVLIGMELTPSFLEDLREEEVAA